MSPRKLTLVCVISILINIFLVGATVGGASWLHARQQGGGGGSIRAAGATLPDDQRREFRRTLGEARREMLAALAAGRQARQQAAVVLRAPTVDPAALDAALAEIRTEDFAVRTHVETRLAAFISTLPPEARAKLADSLVKRPHPSPRR